MASVLWRGWPRWGRARWVATLGAGAVAIVVGAGSVTAGSCIRSDERLSIEVRALQTELMVAALSCHARQDYNAFVTRFSQTLNHHGHTLKGYFGRLYGAAGEREQTRFVTGLANKSALAGVNDMDRFCDRSMETFRAVHAMPLKEFETFTQSRMAGFGPEFAVCTVARKDS